MEETIMRWVFVGVMILVVIVLFFGVSFIVLPYERTFDCRKGEVADRYNYGLFHFTIESDMGVPIYIEQCTG